METNEIINNEEVIETAAEIVKTIPDKGFKTVTSFGIGMFVGGAAYKYILKPAGAKVKNWCAERKAKKYGCVDGTYREVENVEPEEETIEN